MREYEDSDTSEQPTGGLSGPQVKMAPPKGGGMSVQGRIALDPTQTESILSNMQKIIDERNSPMNQWLESMKDAAAWTGGGTEGPTRTLATRDVQRQARQKEIFDMQQQMAAYRAAQKEADAFRKEQGSAYSGLPGSQQGQGVSVSEANALAAQIPGAQSQGGKIYFKGTEIDAATATAMKNARTREERDKIFNAYALESAKSNLKWNADVGAYENKIEEAIDGKIYNLDAMTKRDIRNFAMKNNMSFADAARIYLGITPPSGEQAKQPSAARSGTTAPGLTTNAIKQVESGGRQGLVSPAGAVGVMQTMPNTLKDPGFGVRPARNDSPEEMERVGVDYFKAMQNKYGNDTFAAIAYNMGPGKTDAWIKSGANFNKLPKETQDYIGKVYIANAQQTGPGLTTAPAETTPTQAPATAQPVSARQQQPTLSEIKAQKKLEEEMSGEEGRGRAKEFAQKAIGLEEAASNSTEKLGSIEYIRTQLNNTKTLAILSEPTVAAALGKMLKEGVTLGGSTTSLNAFDEAVAQMMKGASRQDIAAMQNLGREFSKMELIASRDYLKGQGAVSDNERRLIQRSVANIGTNPDAIRDFLALSEMRAKFDKKVGEAWENFQRNNTKGASFNDFRLRDPEFKQLKQAYGKELDEFARTTRFTPEKSTKGSAPVTGTAPTGVKYKVIP
jgi:soluble lytic murein transglycosylase-like protein